MHARAFRNALLLAIAPLFGAELARGQCSGWSAGFQAPGTDAAVHAMAVFDDGSGPALFVGGEFHSVGGVPARGLAKWNGARWTEVGGGVDGPVQPALVLALFVHDDGSGPALFVGGRFTSAGGTPVNAIAKWNGSTWSNVGGGVGSSAQHLVYAFTEYDDGGGTALFATGWFDVAGGVPAKSIAKWDGASWSALGSGLRPESGNSIASGSALAVLDSGSGPELYVGGYFAGAGSVTSRGIARWNGSTWSSVGGGIDSYDGTTHALAVIDDGSGTALYAGGKWASIGGVSAPTIARWNGANWSEVGPGSGAFASGVFVHALTVFDDGTGAKLYAGGDGLSASGQSSNVLYRWDGSTWSSQGLSPHGRVYALGSFDAGSGAKLFAGGFITDSALPARHLLRMEAPGQWSQIGGGLGVRGTVLALTSTHNGPDGGPALYAGGEFDRAGRIAATNVARFDGSSWFALAAGVQGAVDAMSVFDDGGGLALFAGGAFGAAGGVPANNVAKWNGSSWSALASGANGAVRSFAIFDDGGGSALFAGGEFTTIGGAAANCVAKWDGAGWSALSSGMSVATALPSVDALAVFDDGNGPALYAAGAFKVAGGINAQRIARWNGTSWSAVGVLGLDSRARALTVFDDGSGPALYVGGQFTHADGVAVSYAARWNGVAWSATGNPLDTAGWPNATSIYALEVLDDASGPALFAAGSFSSFDAPACRNVARLSGSIWTPAATSGLSGSAYALESFNAGSGAELFAGGLFDRADETVSNAIARWSNPCACQGSSYCTAGTSASGCQASMSSSGSASLAQSSGFVVDVTNVEASRSGIVFFGTSGAIAIPWGNGTSFRCVAAPTIRTGVQLSGGTPGTCGGAFTLDFNAWMSAHASVALAAGASVHMQAWFRDPGNGSDQDTSFSNGLRFVVCP